MNMNKSEHDLFIEAVQYADSIEIQDLNTNGKIGFLKTNSGVNVFLNHKLVEKMDAKRFLPYILTVVESVPEIAIKLYNSNRERGLLA